jgi:hypothetical protein
MELQGMMVLAHAMTQFGRKGSTRYEERLLPASDAARSSLTRLDRRVGEAELEYETVKALKVIFNQRVRTTVLDIFCLLLMKCRRVGRYQ